MSSLEKVTRIEKKYLISTSQKNEMLKKLKVKLIFDEYSIHGLYSVRTLYFDTPDFQDYHDKVNEVPVRKGLRVRIYSTNNKTAKIELKSKDNKIQSKISLKINRNDVEELVKGNYECLKNYEGEVAEQIYSIMKNNNYKPAALILYDRYAFKDPDTKLRVTIDSDLRTTNKEFDLWSENINGQLVSSPEEHILEVKLVDKIPQEIADLIYPLDSEMMTSTEGKYKRCCKFLGIK